VDVNYRLLKFYYIYYIIVADENVQTDNYSDDDMPSKKRLKYSRKSNFKCSYFYLYM